jgi:hypothetical protein
MVSAYVPDTGIQEHLKEHRDMQIWKLRWVMLKVVVLTVSIWNNMEE